MLPAMKLNGTAAIISGGASGLGASVARRLAAAGVTAVLADLNEEQGKAVAAETGGVFVKTDVADENSVTAAVEAAAAQAAPLRIVVSCAGIGWAARTVGRDGTPHDLAAYRKVIDVNLIGTFNLMRIGAAAMARTEPADADGQRGVVINTSSVAGLEGQTGQIAYSASKGGIIGMTVPAARDLAAIGVRVNTICPGIIDTPIYGFAPDAAEFKARLAAPVVFPKRMGTSAEFAHLVQVLIENDYMNAEVIRFDGGIRFQPKSAGGAPQRCRAGGPLRGHPGYQPRNWPCAAQKPASALMPASPATASRRRRAGWPADQRRPVAARRRASPVMM